MGSKEILDLYKEMSNSFCLPGNVDAEPSPSNPHTQTIMERFFRRLSLGNILACLEVKPGYGVIWWIFTPQRMQGFRHKKRLGYSWLRQIVLKYLRALEVLHK